MTNDELRKLNNRIEELDKRITDEFIYVVEREGMDVQRGGHSAYDLIEICKSLCKEGESISDDFKSSIKAMVDNEASGVSSHGFTIKKYEFSEQEMKKMVLVLSQGLRKRDNETLLQKLDELSELVGKYIMANGDRSNYRDSIDELSKELTWEADRGYKTDFPRRRYRKLDDEYKDIAKQIYNRSSCGCGKYTILDVEENYDFKVEDFRKSDREYICLLIDYCYTLDYQNWACGYYNSKYEDVLYMKLPEKTLVERIKKIDEVCEKIMSGEYVEEIED